MHIALLAGDSTKREFLSKPMPSSVQLTVADSIRSFEVIEADAFFDLSFETDQERRRGWSFQKGRPLFVSAVTLSGADLSYPVVRINAWPTFLQRSILEVAVTEAGLRPQMEKVFAALEWKYSLVQDVPGFITARMVAALINEAYFTLGDHVSTKAEIDTAMKLGTNYPYGPFEWSEKIGLENIAGLLRQLAKTDKRYEPAPAVEMDLLLGKRQRGQPL